MNRSVLAILVALCVVAGAGILEYSRFTSKVTQAAKPIPSAHGQAAETGTRQAATGSGPMTNKAVAAKPYQDPTAEISDDATNGWDAASPAFAQDFAVKLDEVVGVGRLVSPGTPVEVLISTHPPGGDARQGSVTKTNLRNIRVLSAKTYTRKDLDGNPEQIEVVHLSVSPEQAVTLSQASERSAILLVLRNRLGTGVYELPGTAMSASLQDSQPSGAKPGKNAVNHLAQRTLTDRDASRGGFYAVQVINGSKTDSSKINTMVFPLPEGMQ